MLNFRARHRYPGGFALDLDFRVERRTTALFGASGSGKTSVIETVAGIRRPAEGLIELDGRPLFDSSRALDLPPQRRRVGAVFQDALLFPHLTVEGNLRFGSSRRRDPRPIAFSRVLEVLELEPLLRRYPGALSGGERRRVALGRALLSGPDLLLLDEPLVALDDRLKNRILASLERVIREWDIPALFVSHSQAEVRRLADWVVVLNEGRVLTQGTPEDALAEPGLLARRDDAGPMNVLRVEELRPHGEHWTARVGDRFLQLPPLPEPPVPPLYIQFPPGAVLLSRHDIPDISARNRLRGTVRQVVEVAQTVYVSIDVGQVLWAVLTPEALHELDIAPGSPVTCLIKTHSLTVT